MKNPNNSCKRTGGLAALVLVGLLAGQAARAEVMTFETSLAPITAGSAGTVTMPAAYQPLPYVKIGYSSGYNSLYYCFSTLTAYQWDHTTTSYGGTHNVGFQTYAGSTYPITYTFDQPVSLPSFFVSTWNGGSGKNNVIIRAFSNTTGTTQLYSNMVAVAYPWSGWTTFTNLASLGTNIMRLEIASTNNYAMVDDITVYSTNAFGPVQGIQFQLPPAGTLQPGDSRLATVLANYASRTNTATTWATFSSSDPTVATVPQQGGSPYVTAVSPGTASIIATFGGFSATNTVTVSPLPAAATLVTFNNASNYLSAPVLTIAMPAVFNPVASLGLTNTWTNVGLFNGGPDHTVGLLGYNDWVAAQTNSSLPQVYTFSKPVSLPSLWLTTGAGVADGGSNLVTIITYSDTAGTTPLGTNLVTTPTHGGPGNFQWVQSTDLDNATYNGKIQRVEISALGNAQVDNMSVVLNYGTLTNLTMALPLTTLKPAMSRQLAVTGKYDSGSNVFVTASALFSSSDPTVATVTPYGCVKAISGGTATISAAVVTNSAAAQGVTNTVTVTVQGLPANATLVTFNDGGWPQHMFNFAPIASSGYEPVPDLFINWPFFGGYLGTQLYDGVGGGAVDHTTGLTATTLAGGNNYCALTTDGSLVFNRPVGIPSVFLGNGLGNATTKTTNVIVQAWSDPAGTVQIYSNSVPTPLPNYSFVEFTDLASLGNTIMRVRFASTNYAAFDDMTVIAPPLGALQALRLQLPQTNFLVNASTYAGAWADYLNVSNVNVSAACGTVYTSSDPTILTISGGTAVSTGVVVRAVSPGTATLTATLGAASSSATVIVGQQPAITNAPASQVVECGGNATFTVAASGYPAPSFQWSVNSNAVAGATSSTFTTNNVHSAGNVYTITCTANNVFGSVSSNATLTVQDTTAPVPDLGSLPTVTGQCSASVTAPTAHDACDGLISGTTTDPLNYTAQGTFTVHWTYTDSQGHSSTQNQTVTVQDTQPPVITWSFTNATVSADTNCQALMPDVTGTNYIMASDNCSALLTITQTPTNNAALALGTNEVVIAVNDGHGNVAYSTNTIVVADTTPPVVTVLGDNPLTTAYHAAFTDPGATASDNCAGVSSLTTNSTVDLNVPGTYSIAYIATDAAGNSSTNARAVVVTDALLALHLQLASTSLVPGLSQQATVLGDYASESGVDVTATVAYSSSAPAVAAVTSGGLVQALAPGSTTITATLDTVSDSVPVVVTALNLQMSLAGTSLTFSWSTDATTSFILESSPVIGPDAVWTAVSGTPTVVGSNFQLEVPIDPETAAAYFRLRLQP